MGLRFYNTLTRRVEPFAPLEPGTVRMYTCGPTVYDRAHIGNFRTFTWEDLLRRYLRWKGYRVVQVMNLTDVDDKTIQAALARGVSLAEVTEPVVEAFFEDLDALGLERVEHYPRATEHLPGMIDLIARLERRGLTYRADGSVYFAIARFPAYGRLAGLDPEAVSGATRARGDEEYEKDDPRDFVLWKGGERGEESRVASWDSPWGPGRPGWHLECSAMAMEHLGETLDIHTGGVDNIFPHHTNEIAQSEGATGKPFARYWLHAAHLLVDGSKMSKSLGNYHTVRSLLDMGHPASAIRQLLLSGHYRSQLNFTIEGLEQAERTLDRLDAFRRRVRAGRLEAGPAGPEAGAGPKAVTGPEALAEPEASADSVAGRGSPGPAEAGLAASAGWARAAFEEAMDDDLNVSEALAAVFGFVRDVNQRLDEGEGDENGLAAVERLLSDFDAVFGVLSLRDAERSTIPGELRAWLEERIASRQAARRSGDYELADRIREEVERRGFVLEDGPHGTRWKVGDAAIPAQGAERG